MDHGIHELDVLGNRFGGCMRAIYTAPKIASPHLFVTAVLLCIINFANINIYSLQRHRNVADET